MVSMVSFTLMALLRAKSFRSLKTRRAAPAPSSETVRVTNSLHASMDNALTQFKLIYRNDFVIPVGALVRRLSRVPEVNGGRRQAKDCIAFPQLPSLSNSLRPDQCQSTPPKLVYPRMRPS